MARKRLSQLWVRSIIRIGPKHNLRIDWSWLSMDGCMTKAPLGGEKRGKNPTDRAKGGVKRSQLVDAKGIPVGVISKARSAEMSESS